MKCIVDGCNRQAKNKYQPSPCIGHYIRLHNTGKYGSPNFKQKTLQPLKCVIEECDRKPMTHGLCAAHYQRKRTGVSLQSAIKPIIKTTIPEPSVAKIKQAENKRNKKIKSKAGKSLKPIPVIFYGHNSCTR